MPGGFTNKPKILRGAFVEYGQSLDQHSTRIIYKSYKGYGKDQTNTKNSTGKRALECLHIKK